jgi:hypothetical protein
MHNIHAVSQPPKTRAAALSEVLWTGSGGDFDHFKKRLPADMQRLKTMGVNYAPHLGSKP